MTDDEIDDRIDRWHAGEGDGRPLHEFLGWSRERYAAWLTAPGRPVAAGRPDWYRDVLDFHRKFGCHVGSTPAVPSEGTPELRARLLREEFDETLDALGRGDLPALADGLADLIYVLLGTAASYGIDLRPVWAAVHAANMAKDGGGTRADGKVLKPPGWAPPDIEGILSSQGPIA